MRQYILKVTGLVLWALFLSTPFIAKAESGDPFDLSAIAPAAGETLDFLSFPDGVYLPLEDRDHSSSIQEGKLSVKLSAGKDSVLLDDLSAKVNHDRIFLDDGVRKSMRFGVGLHYSF